MLHRWAAAGPSAPQAPLSLPVLLSASPEGRGTNTLISDPLLFDILYKVFPPFPLCCQLCFSISPNSFWPHFNISQNVLGLVLIFSSPAETRALSLCWCSGLSAFSVSFSKWCLCMGASYLPSPKALFLPSPHSPVQGALVPQGCSSRGCGLYSQGCQGGDTAPVGAWRRDKWCHLLNDVKLMSSILIHQADTSPISQCHSQVPPVPVTSPVCLFLPFLCVAAGGNPKYPKAEEALGEACAGHGLLQDAVRSSFKAAL